MFHRDKLSFFSAFQKTDHGFACLESHLPCVDVGSGYGRCVAGQFITVKARSKQNVLRDREPKPCEHFIRPSRNYIVTANNAVATSGNCGFNRNFTGFMILLYIASSTGIIIRYISEYKVWIRIDGVIGNSHHCAFKPFYVYVIIHISRYECYALATAVHKA